MDVLVLSDDPEVVARWRRAFASVSPTIRVCETDGLQTAVAAVVDGPSRGRLVGLPKLRVILAPSAGVDALLQDPTLPDLPIIRLIPPETVDLMREYILYHVIRLRRRFGLLAEAQGRSHWSDTPLVGPASSCRVSVLGLGRLGVASALILRDVGYTVAGWSRTQRTIPGIRCESGCDGLSSVANTADILISLLPLTSDTCGLLDASLFRQLPSGASIINAGRGASLRQADLLSALDDGTVAHAVLDVFETEPLPASSPLWTHPRVTVTPHVAADPSLYSVAQRAFEILRSVLADVETTDHVDRSLGY